MANNNWRHEFRIYCANVRSSFACTLHIAQCTHTHTRHMHHLRSCHSTNAICNENTKQVDGHRYRYYAYLFRQICKNKTAHQRLRIRLKEFLLEYSIESTMHFLPFPIYVLIYGVCARNGRWSLSLHSSLNSLRWDAMEKERNQHPFVGKVGGGGSVHIVLKLIYAGGYLHSLSSQSHQTSHFTHTHCSVTIVKTLYIYSPMSSFLHLHQILDSFYYYY